jgi:hypothetical protein
MESVTAEKKDSHDLCFIGKVRASEFFDDKTARQEGLFKIDKEHPIYQQEDKSRLTKIHFVPNIQKIAYTPEMGVNLWEIIAIILP